MDDHTVTIKRIVSRVGKEVLVRDRAKTEAGEATLPLPDVTYNALVAHKARLKEAALKKKGGTWREDSWVFPSTHGTVIEPRNINRALSKALEELDLPHSTPHQLRHDFSGFLLMAGIQPRVQQELMRHTRYSTTAEKYQQPPDELQWAAAAKLDELLSGPKTA
jgi:integrase